MIWQSDFITPIGDYGEICPIFKKEFKCKKTLDKAHLYITAVGVYAAQLNGKKVSDYIMAPGWTVYKKRHQYQVYDISDGIGKNNIITVIVGRGWYRGRIAKHLKEEPDYLTDLPAIISQIELRYNDGTCEIISSDSSWFAAKSPLLFSDIYDGEIYDSTKNDIRYHPVRVMPEIKKDNLILQEGEKITEHERIKPLCYIVTPKGERVIDFGQNLTGYIEFTVDAKAGERVSISHGEILDKDGNFYNANYRSAKAKLEYVCRNGKQTYKPQLTFFGFRFIRIDEFPTEINPDDFTAIAVYSNMKRTGSIACSNPMLNKLISNIFWGQKSNFLDVPTDCPQRDERLGWTGDAQVFVRTASYNYNVEKFFAKWLADLSADQGSDGHVPFVVPNVWNEHKKISGVLNGEGSAAWGDAAVICPWQIYLTYGNKSVLEKQFDSMKKWVDYITKTTKNDFLWTGGNHLGDWLAMDGNTKSRRGGSNDEFIASVYYAYSALLIYKAGLAIGREVSEYKKLYEDILKCIRQTYPTYKTQTEHALALYFNIASNKDETAASLAQMVRDNGYRLTTGFVGTPYLLHALSQNGYPEIAYSLLLQDDFPSWLYSVKMGATTIWEHWDGVKKDGSFWDPMMNSYNHYAYGSVADWIYGVAAGIQTVEHSPGFAEIVFSPTPDDRLDWLHASIETRFGTVSSRWYRCDGVLRYEIVTPSPATVKIGKGSFQVEPGTYIF